MRVGSIVYDSLQALGILAHSFFKAGVLTDLVVVNHKTRPSQRWYPWAPRISGSTWGRDRDAVESMLKRVDVALFFETPFHWDAIPLARKYNVKTALMVMHECLPPPNRLPYQPDLILCPSLLDQQVFPDRSVHIPVPVDVQWKKREKALTFVHNAGNLGLLGRNGTAELVDALPLVTVPAKILIRSQKRLDQRLLAHIEYARHKGVDVEYLCSSLSQEQLWGVGDVFVFPERFNGLSLPLQEARASGMVVCATARFPNTSYLPQEELIPVRGYRRNRISPRCNWFDDAVVDPADIAAKINSLYGRDISEYSEGGRRWAEENSWEALKPRYLEELGK